MLKRKKETNILKWQIDSEKWNLNSWNRKKKSLNSKPKEVNDLATAVCWTGHKHKWSE